MRTKLILALAATLMAGPALAQTAKTTAATASEAKSSPELDACKASGLIALKQHSPAVKDVSIDPDTVSVSNTDTAVEQTKVKTVILGLATIETAKKEKPNQFVCLIGEKGKVLLTFFTQK